MEITIDSVLSEKIPGFKAGCIVYKNITVSTSPQMIKGRLHMYQESLYFDLLEKDLTSFEGIKEWRQVFKKTGTDPSRYRHSAEALYRRVKKQNFLVPIHSAIDLNNFFSLQYAIPFGIYDADQLSGNIEFTIGNETDVYTGLNGRENVLNKMIVAKDQEGPFGTPFVDSERSKVTDKTVNALHIIYLRPSIQTEEAYKLIDAVRNMFTQVHGGEAESRIIS
ncbi:DNA/RNA-binding domain of Phe-tRNA-synthetase-like protein [Peribacillus deserti]|uniref:DNA/RNA-binding domain of Phe-tRNA-synthetase-like protein n=1 Tax=Peribacillus deserti TaxID=673318 RepID=A0ABS2QM21_9BACI|nr:phenylalanine--tRNA ligase beta subunit-related protein [Peribacillus deserti]MBM7694221.1 DNA/RNA-binding domain of Phe-tRNA-synthetase-like protein [Peribacillus deserti]